MQKLRRVEIGIFLGLPLFFLRVIHLLQVVSRELLFHYFLGHRGVDVQDCLLAAFADIPEATGPNQNEVTLLPVLLHVVLGYG